MTQSKNILLSAKLSGINDPAYTKFLKKSKDLKIWSEKEEDYVHLEKDFQNIVANYAYFIYEYLEKNNSRKIDYRVVKKFAKEYKNMLDYLFAQTSLQSKLNSWLKEKVEMVEMGMYMPTNSYNKNVHH
ncbi:hypothetical protein [Ferruginibacter albus]|uniref:hypothetical protein n=1 Tax=Ferruginibacter albus TaxID=2875540 RepID=UPI001CC54814|nr:hypothetical protein [Ferruginibacter albus]UAY51297.1 hypothetical protein K9M53_11930 [Ferruginibacter albus]